MKTPRHFCLHRIVIATGAIRLLHILPAWCWEETQLTSLASPPTVPFDPGDLVTAFHRSAQQAFSQHHASTSLDRT